MLECPGCGTKNVAGASMCITCGSKRLLTESGERYEVSSQPKKPLPTWPEWYEPWQEFLARVGGAYSFEGGIKLGSIRLFQQRKFRIQVDDWIVSLERWVSRSSTTTVMSAPYIARSSFDFHVYRRTVMSDLGKRLGLQDLEIGDPEFDREFIVKASDEPRLRELFANSSLRSRLQDDARIYLLGYGGTLNFRESGTVTDVDFLVAVHELFVGTLRELQRLRLIE